MRKMMENPAGKAMMNQGVKMMVAMMYGDFIDGLELSKEEAEYFRGLLGEEMSSAQEMGLKMMGQDKAEATNFVEEMKRQQEESDKKISEFLNNEEDYQAFKHFKERMPERQQLDGIRNAFAAKELGLDEQTESSLVEAMFRARTSTQPGSEPDVAGMEAMAEGKLGGYFEESWKRQQDSLRKEVGGVLTEPQQAAFFEYQQQLYELQAIQVKMAEQMMQPSEKK